MIDGVPETRYVKAPDGVHLAYKVFGDEPVDLLFLWQNPLAFDAAFEHPAHLRYWRFASSFSRIIGYDRRGLGASDPAPPESFGDRQVWADDALTVLDAVGAEQVIVQGEGFGGHEALAFAVAHPDRIRGLVLVNSFPRLVRTSDYPFGVEPDFVDVALQFAETAWGTGAVIASGVPRLASESSFRDLWGPSERMAASPATAAACIGAMYRSDVRDLLASIAVPTLVMYTADLAFVAAEHSRYLAEHISGATLIETPVQSFWDFEPYARRAVQEFISGISTEVPWERELLAVMFTDIVSSTERALSLGDAAWRGVIEDHDTYVKAQVTRNHGRVIKQTGDGHLAVFARPLDAIRTAVRIRDAARVQGLEIRAGLHFGEVLSRSDGDVTGSAVNVAARVMQHAGASEVLVSHTLSDLVTGSDIEFVDQGEHDLKGVPGGWRLFLVRN